MQPRSGQAKIEQDHALGPAGLRNSEHVGRLDVGVNEPGLVGGAEPGQQLPSDSDRPVHGQGALPIEQGLQILAAQKFHGEEQTAVLGQVGLKDADYVRVIDAADVLDLLHEQAPVVGGRVDGRMQDLDRHVPVHGHLPGAVHHPEVAGRQHRLEAKPSRQHQAAQVFLGGRRRARGCAFRVHGQAAGRRVPQAQKRRRR